MRLFLILSLFIICFCTPSKSTHAVEKKILYLEQFYNGFYGWGMRKEEKDKIDTTTQIEFSDKNGYKLKVKNADLFVIGQTVVIAHDNNIYKTYKIVDKYGSILTIKPKLKFPISSKSQMQSTWKDRAHPGPYYMRVLAQRIVSKIDELKSTGSIVIHGDSWVSRLYPQLKLELNNVNIIDSGKGGNTIQDLLDRFDTDVSIFNPEIVIVVVGTNDVYKLDNTKLKIEMKHFESNLNRLIEKCFSINSNIILVGIPALAEEDVQVFSDWELNTKARLLNSTEEHLLHLRRSALHDSPFYFARQNWHAISSFLY